MAKAIAFALELIDSLTEYPFTASHPTYLPAQFTFTAHELTFTGSPFTE